jgi:hypothetical protein
MHGILIPRIICAYYQPHTKSQRAHTCRPFVLQLPERVRTCTPTIEIELEAAIALGDPQGSWGIHTGWRLCRCVTKSQVMERDSKGGRVGMARVAATTPCGVPPAAGSREPSGATGARRRSTVFGHVLSSAEGVHVCRRASKHPTPHLPKTESMGSGLKSVT